MKLADFTSGGPYLHQQPGHPEGKADNFMAKDISVPRRGMETDFAEQKQTLATMVKAAEDRERRFFEIFKNKFGVGTPEQFSAMFLVPTATEEYFQQKDKILNAGPLTQKIHLILNNPELQSDLTLVDKPDAIKILNNMITDEAQERLHDFVQNEIVTGDMIISLIRRMLEGRRETSSYPFHGRNITGEVVCTLPISFKDINFSGDFMQEFAPRTAVRKQLSFSKQSISKFTYEMLTNSKISNIIDKAVARAKARVAQDLEKYITLKDVLDVLQVVKARIPQEEKRQDELARRKRKEIISFVNKEFQEFLQKEVINKKGSLYRFNSYATGELLNFGLEISLNTLAVAKMNARLSKIASSVGTTKALRDGMYHSTEVPSDLKMLKGVLAQLKSSRVSLDGFDVPEIRLAYNMRLTGLLQGLTSENRISSSMSDDIAYQVANHIHRGNADALMGMAETIVNWAVEMYVRSDTIRSFITDVEGKVSYPMSLGNPEEIAQNTFWVIRDQLIGVSTFLQAALDLMNGTEAIESWYTISGAPFVSSNSIDNAGLWDQKKSVFEWNWQKSIGNKGYSASVLTVGKQAGSAIIAGVGLGQINLSNNFLRGIANLNNRISK